MNLPRPPRSSRTDIDMVPMINIAFLLLTFFLLLGRFGPREPFPVRAPRADLPAADSAPAPALLVAADGRLAFAGEALEAAAVAARLGAWQAAHPGLPLDLKADAQSDAANLVRLLATLRAAGIAEVRLLTRRADG